MGMKPMRENRRLVRADSQMRMPRYFLSSSTGLCRTWNAGRRVESKIIIWRQMVQMAWNEPVKYLFGE